ncbi:MAG: 1-acyl-sn-glycerol-3-phosphate acyltransferase [Ruminococcaceae bacterium]|nr:1-acyl-sn-glycerol-3-phosphate acyltransferase [Oscillospiraceae bacterium]
MSKEKKKRQGSRFFRVVYACLSGIVGLIFRIKVVNPENEPLEGGYVVCANHISATDPIVISYAFKRNQLNFMAKKELFKIPLLRGLISMLGAFPIDRGGNDVGAIKKAVSIVEEGKCLGVFPQGHRYPCQDPRKTETKNGAALIATRAEADIVPVYIWCKGKKQRIFKRTYVVIGERISFESFEYDKDNQGEYTRVTGIVFDKVCSLGEDFEKKLRDEGKIK